MKSGCFYLSGLISKTRRYFSWQIFHCLLVLLLATHYLFAQRLQIDSLKTEISHLNAKSLVDCLNTLSLVYTYLQSDSATSYAQRADSIASSINYGKGIAMALNNQAHIAGLALHNYPLQEKISFKTIELSKTLGDNKLLVDGNMNLALALFCQSDFIRSSDVCKQIIQLSQKISDQKQLGEATAILGSVSFETGDYERSFEYFTQSLQIFSGIKDSYNTAILLVKIGDLYRMAGDNKMAMSLYSKSLKYPIANSLTWYPLADLGDTYYSLEQFDSASTEQDKYMQAIKALTVRSNYITIPKILVAENYLAVHEYDKALPVLLNELSLSEKNNDRNKTMRSLLDISKTYKDEKKIRESFYFTRRLLQNAQTYQLHQYLRDGYQLMYMLYDDLHNTDSAYAYYRRYTFMKNFVAVDEFSKKIALYKTVAETEKKQQQIELLSKEKLIALQQLQLNKQQLKNDSILKNILTGSVLFLILLSFFIFRNIRLKQKHQADKHELLEKEFKLQQMESEKIKSDMQQKTAELELQAIRAQMNPHFIFNCLNSINRFIINNDAEAAANYLTKFAKLIRIVLEQSDKSFVPLDDEIACLKLYMDLEKLRFDQPFQYTINCSNIDSASVTIPTLLIQPFVENAIWHGLHPKKNGVGEINITMSANSHAIHCSICDNGVGINNTTEKIQTDKKSLGMYLTQQRLQLLDDTIHESFEIKIEQLKETNGQVAGTCVSINIPFKESDF